MVYVFRFFAALSGCQQCLGKLSQRRYPSFPGHDRSSETGKMIVFSRTKESPLKTQMVDKKIKFQKCESYAKN